MVHNELLADKLASDPRFLEAKKKLIDLAAEYHKKIDGPKPPSEKLSLSYKDLLKELESYRSAPLYYPYLGSGFGNGPLVELADGSIKYDMIAGIGPHFFGHASLIALEGSLDAVFSDLLIQGNLQQNREALLFSSLLTKYSGLPHCFISTTGVMANENALKIAFQKRFPASRVLAFERCFSGRTLAMSQVTDKAAYREGLPSFLHVDYIPYFDAEHPEESILAAEKSLKSHLKRYPKQHAAMFLELIQGEGGCYPGSQEFFSRIGSILKNEGIAFIADEVQTFGRTEELFAFQYFELGPYVDMVTVGKMSQACATLFSNEWAPRSGLLSQTFTANTSSLITGSLLIKTLVEGGFYGREGKIAKIAKTFAIRFEEIRKKMPEKIKGPYGLGGMIAFTPLKGTPNKVLEFLQKLFQNGVIAFQTGSDPLRARLLPPIPVLKEKDIDAVCAIIEKTLHESEA